MVQPRATLCIAAQWLQVTAPLGELAGVHWLLRWFTNYLRWLL
ncbi:hypothetical protein Tco_0348807, partial [Tanacetum coccineum]